MVCRVLGQISIVFWELSIQEEAAVTFLVLLFGPSTLFSVLVSARILLSQSQRSPAGLSFS